MTIALWAPVALGAPWKWSFPMSPSVRPSVGRMVGRSVCLNFLNGRKVSLPCPYRINCFINTYILYVTRFNYLQPINQYIPLFSMFLSSSQQQFISQTYQTRLLYSRHFQHCCVNIHSHILLFQRGKKGGQGHLKHTKKGDTDFPGIFDRESMRFEFTKTMHDFCFLKLYFDKSRICPRQKVKKACRCGSSWWSILLLYKRMRSEDSVGKMTSQPS